MRQEHYYLKKMMWPPGVYLCMLASFHISLLANVQAEPTNLGFVSIDCGIPSGHSYTDETTNMTYVCDDGFVNTGENRNISLSDDNLFGVQTQGRNLRVFPDGDRNCYSIKSVVKGRKYLVRANFLHGNYDGSGTSENEGLSVAFDLHIDNHHWDTLNISGTLYNHEKELLHIAKGNYLLVCLINIKQGSPFISSLEVRPLKSTSYQNVMSEESFDLISRDSVGDQPMDVIRYPSDPYDRKWHQHLWAVCCDNITSTDPAAPCYDSVSSSNISNYDGDTFEIPSIVMQKAIVPTNSQALCLPYALWGPSINNVLVIFHFTDFQREKRREFNAYADKSALFFPDTDKPHSSPFLKVDHLWLYGEVRNDHQAETIFSLNATNNSQLPPILSAVEIYSSIDNDNYPYISTLEDEVEAMFAIRDEYEVKKNWFGDPCSSAKYRWTGLTCSSDGAAWRIQSINLSSSGLHGAISDHFSKLKSLQNLDLSYNSLNGTVPESLIRISTLRILNLTGNQFNGEFPRLLCTTRTLAMRFENGEPCSRKSSNKKNLLVPVIATTGSVVVIVLMSTIVMFCLRRYHRIQRVNSKGMPLSSIKDISSNVDYDGHLQKSSDRVLTYDDIVKATDNFSSLIGQGGFGPVFKGRLRDGTQVAVKMCSQTPTHGQGMREFYAEVQSLTTVHHRSLVQLVGYCTDKQHLALVYEYMPNGNLHDHLRGQIAFDQTLRWRERARIALEAAQGLDYLHTGCVLPIIHRDVKPHNILIGQDMRAKISDFGLSRSFVSASQTHISVTAAGTPGYMDPEYYLTSRLTENSDVFSFGVVLLEIVTGEPPILPGVNHIAQRVRQMVREGNIGAVVDPRLRGDYDINSVWKVVDVALLCTMEAADARPAMAIVVAQLSGALALEEARVGGTYPHGEDNTQEEACCRRSPSVADDLSSTQGPSAR